MKRRIRINGIIIILASAAATLFPRAFLRGAGAKWEFAAVALGFCLLACGQLLRVSARGYKAEHSGHGERLVTGGPYALVRNPMYLGIFLIGCGINLVLFKLWLLCAFLAVFALRYLKLIIREEKKLAAAFPGQWQAYGKDTPRIFPSPARIFSAGKRDYFPLRRSWFKKEIGSILGVFAGAILLKAWALIVPK